MAENLKKNSIGSEAILGPPIFFRPDLEFSLVALLFFEFLDISEWCLDPHPKKVLSSNQLRPLRPLC